MNNDGNVVAQISKRLQAYYFHKRVTGIRRTIRPGDVYKIPPRVIDPYTYSTSDRFRVKRVYPFGVEFEKNAMACTPWISFLKLALYGKPLKTERPVEL